MADRWRRLAATAAGALAAGVLGVALFVAAVAVHRCAWRLGQVTVPWGLALGVGASLACALAVVWLAPARLVAVGVPGGWLAGMSVVLAGRPEGDFAIAGDWLGWGFLLLGGGGAALLLGFGLTAPATRAAAGSGSGRR